MKIKLNPAIILFGLSALLSCSKETIEKPAVAEKPKATFEVFSPAANSNYLPGDTIYFRMNLKADEALHGYDLKVLSLPDSMPLFVVDAHSHKATLVIDTFWVNNVTAIASGVVHIETALDHNGNIGVKEIPLTFNRP